MLSVLLIPVVLLALQPAIASNNVTLALLAPQNAPTVTPNLISLSIEQDRWAEWAGTTSRNDFFYNVLSNLKDITGQPPFIRIGADSEDHTNFNADVEFSEDIFPAYSTTTPYPEATNITVGQDYYNIASNLPSGTQVWWGVNFGQANITAAFLEAQAIITAFNSPAMRSAGVTLDFIEIGNEADLYINNGARTGNWNITEYVAQWTTFATNISNAVHLTLGSGPQLIGGAFANSDHSPTGFSPQGLFNEGILQTEPGPLIKVISQHHYSGSFCSGNGGLLQALMEKATIRSNLTEYVPDIQATQAQGLTYILGETNSYSCHGAPNVSNTAGAALWTLDYSLYSSQIGIERVHFHDGVGFKYNLIQPVALNRSILTGAPLSDTIAPHIQPQYYAAIIAAEALGNSGFTKVVEIPFNNTWLAGYAFYEGPTLARAVIINSQAYFAGAGNRTSQQVNITFSGAGLQPQTMTVKRLAIGYADDASGLSWGGQTYETADGLISGQPSVETVPVSSGVSITETEVVLLSFNFFGV